MESNRGRIARRRRRLREQLRALSEQPVMRVSVVERLREVVEARGRLLAMRQARRAG